MGLLWNIPFFLLSNQAIELIKAQPQLGKRGFPGKIKQSFPVFLVMLATCCSSLPLLSASPPWMTLATRMSPVISWRLMVAPWGESTVESLFT